MPTYCPACDTLDSLCSHCEGCAACCECSYKVQKTYTIAQYSNFIPTILYQTYTV